MKSNANLFRRNAYHKMMSLLKRLFEVNFFFSNILVPLIALVLYCGSFAYLSSRFLVQGVNYFFVSKLGNYLLLVLIGSVLVLLVLLKASLGSKLSLKSTNEKLHINDLILLLLPLTPVAQYIISNQKSLYPTDTLYVLMFFVVFSSIYVFALPAVLSTVMPTRTLMLLGLAFVFTIASMASISDYYRWFGIGTLRKQLMVFAVVFLVTWLVSNLGKRQSAHLFIALYFVTNISVQLISEAGSTDVVAPVEENKLLSLVGQRTPATTPSIYLLVYDAYVSNETMRAYGIDNSAQEDYLLEQGFQLYPHTYSIGSFTLDSMSGVLDVSTRYSGGSRRAVAGDGTAQSILKSLGYKTYGLFTSDFMFRAYGESYDYSVPETSTPFYIQLLKAILIGEFRFDIEQVGFDEQTHDEFLETKQRIFRSVPWGSIFVYMHSNLPTHSQNSGACLLNETELFEERLILANSEMRQDLDLIIENDPNAIIIVAGDHGPYLTKNCHITTDVYNISEISRLDIQDRYGTFLAVRWPTGDFIKYDDITVLQDVFPAVFAYLYKDTKILEAKIEPVIPVPNNVSGAWVENGIIYGGIDDGEPLFLSEK